MMGRALLLVGLALLASCASVPQTPEEKFGRQVMFTVAGSDESPGVRSRGTSVISQIMSLHNLKKVSQWSIRALGLETIVAEIRGERRSVDDVLQALGQDGRIESAQPVQLFKVLGYNDPYFHLQDASVNNADIQAVHGAATGREVVVALVDTGVDRMHPELKDRIIYSHNHVDHDAAEFDNDEHGTSVAGVIASAANNELGIVGIAPNAHLLALKACWQDRETRRARCDSYSLTKALVDALERRPDVINLSLAGPPDPLMARVIRKAVERGIVVIAAVDEAHRERFPASMPEVIAVGTTLSNNSPLPPNGILAPGTDILTTTPGATYAFRSGSSMATAYVSAVAALLREHNHNLSTQGVLTLLRGSALEVRNAVPVVDICRAVLNPGDPVSCHIHRSMAATAGCEGCNSSL
ncbi:MAG: S8 family serine peptidase [Pseudomonadota bacterium]